MKDFYVILPSGPIANHYIVSWENPIEINQHWKVALTEITFNVALKSINSAFGIRSTIMERSTKIFPLEVYFIPGSVSLWYDGVGAHMVWSAPNLEIRDNKLFISCDYEFDITFSDLKGAKSCGFASTETISGSKRQIISKNNVTYTHTSYLYKYSPYKITFKYYSVPFTREYEISCNREILCFSQKEMARAIKSEIGIFFDLEYNAAIDRMKMTIAKDVVSIEFLHGLNIVLGFDTTYIQGLHTYVGDFSPQILQGLNNMHIYIPEYVSQYRLVKYEFSY